MRCRAGGSEAAGPPWGAAQRRRPRWAQSRPGPAAAAGEGAVPVRAGGRPWSGLGAAAQQEVGARRRRLPEAPGGNGAVPGAALPGGTRQVGQGTGRGAGSARSPGSAGAAAGEHLHPACGSAPPRLSKIAGTVTNTLQVKQSGGEDRLKAL